MANAVLESRVSFLAPLCAGLLLAAGCGRLADLDDREGFGEVGADADAGQNDAGQGEDPGSGGEISESCWDGIVQPGEICQVQAPAIDAGIDPCSLTIADINGDTRPDLAVPNSDWYLPESATHVTHVLRGYGNGGFAKAEAHDAGEALPVGLAVGDFDGDGDRDIATANNEANKAYLTMNQGAMDFAAPIGESVGTTASSISAGDVDNDGFDDLVVTTPDGLALIKTGPGGPEFSAMIDMGSGTPMHAELVDLDDDGLLDLIAAMTDSFGANDRVVVLHGAGDGSFPERVEHPVGQNPWWVVAGDLNMDGDLDLLSADYGGASVSILLGNSLGGFSERTELPVCWGPQSVAIGDLNSDGANDIVVGCMDSDLIEVHLQIEDGEFERARWWSTGSTPVSVRLGDLNLDGVPDVAWANQYGNSVGMALSHP